MKRLLHLVTAGTLLAAFTTAQMEKRDDELYARQAFLAAAPAVGTAAPELLLTDLDGKQCKLSAWRGRVVVLIKGGFT